MPARSARVRRERRPRARLRVPLCALRVGARLGVTLDARARWTAAIDHAARRRGASAAAARLLKRLESGACALIHGPSGAGKTTLLRALACGLRTRGVRCVTPRTLPRSCPVARVGVPARATDDALDAWLGMLAHLGLAEAGALLSRVGALSTGQRARVELAEALQRAARSPRPACLLIDELGGTLDRLSVRSVCAGLRRLARTHRLRVIVATAHHDVHAMLRPAVHVRVDLHARFTVMHAAGAERVGGASCA